jgi:IS5 family transposase
MKQPHDSKIGWQMVKCNLDKLNILTADKGYDWWLLRQRLRADRVKTVIKHREFGWHGIANNFLQDDTIYHQRSNAESHFSRFTENTARSFELKPGSVSSANSS